MWICVVERWRWSALGGLYTFLLRGGCMFAASSACFTARVIKFYGGGGWIARLEWNSGLERSAYTLYE